MIDETQQIAKNYGAVCTPDFYGFNSSRELQYRGRFDDRGSQKNYNPNQSDLFKTLTRMFSGPITQRRTQSGRQLRRRHLDIYAKRFKSASGQQFKKTEYNPMNIMTLNMISNRNRAERYVDFDQMEFTPEIASSLDIYADEMTTYSALNPMLHIKCPNDEIKTINNAIIIIIPKSIIGLISDITSDTKATIVVRKV